MTNSLAFRFAVGAALWVTGALVISGFLLARLFDAHVERIFERRLAVLLETLVAVAEVDRTGPGLVLRRQAGEPRFAQPYSGWYWQITAADGTEIRSYSLWDQRLAAAEGPPPEAPRLSIIEGPDRARVWAIERAIRMPGAEGRYRFMVAADAAELEIQTGPFNRTLAWALFVLWFGLLIGIAAQIVIALRPLGRLRRGLRDVSAGRGERLVGRFPAEVEPLVAELNAHFDQIRQVVERARGHVGNLAHALKTPLSVLANEASGDDGVPAETVRSQTDAMRRRVDHYLVRARTAATAGLITARAPLAEVIEDLRRTLVRIHAGRDLAIEVESPAGLEFRGDRQDLEEMIGNLMDNACKWAGHRVRIGAVAHGNTVSVTVEDDGPGMPPAGRGEALGRGKRLDEAVDGSGLGLAIVDEIAGLYGGTLALEDSAMGGLRAVLVLPAAAR